MQTCGAWIVSSCSQARRDITARFFAFDDVYDAIAALWSARRIAEKKANAFPETLEKDGRGFRMAIWA
jgi:predicted RNase H-like nuclease